MTNYKLTGAGSSASFVTNKLIGADSSTTVESTSGCFLNFEFFSLSFVFVSAECVESIAIKIHPANSVRSVQTLSRHLSELLFEERRVPGRHARSE